MLCTGCGTLKRRGSPGKAFVYPARKDPPTRHQGQRIWIDFLLSHSVQARMLATLTACLRGLLLGQVLAVHKPISGFRTYVVVGV